MIKVNKLYSNMQSVIGLWKQMTHEVSIIYLPINNNNNKIDVLDYVKVYRL